MQACPTRTIMLRRNICLMILLRANYHGFVDRHFLDHTDARLMASFQGPIQPGSQHRREWKIRSTWCFNSCKTVSLAGIFVTLRRRQHPVGIELRRDLAWDTRRARLKRLRHLYPFALAWFAWLLCFDFDCWLLRPWQGMHQAKCSTALPKVFSRGLHVYQCIRTNKLTAYRLELF